jgi:hypothetical protein
MKGFRIEAGEIQMIRPEARPLLVLIPKPLPDDSGNNQQHQR